jgi:hypothetical protein
LITQTLAQSKLLDIVISTSPTPSFQRPLTSHHLRNGSFTKYIERCIVKAPPNQGIITKYSLLVIQAFRVLSCRFLAPPTVPPLRGAPPTTNRCINGYLIYLEEPLLSELLVYILFRLSWFLAQLTHQTPHNLSHCHPSNSTHTPFTFLSLSLTSPLSVVHIVQY